MERVTKIEEMFAAYDCLVDEDYNIIVKDNKIHVLYYFDNFDSLKQHLKELFKDQLVKAIERNYDRYQLVTLYFKK